MKSFGPTNPAYPHMLHGGDYNPDQWMHIPGIWEEDMRLMKLAVCNAMSLAIFSWASLEPREGEFEFGWLDAIMDKLADNGAYALMATPPAQNRHGSVNAIRRLAVWMPRVCGSLTAAATTTAEHLPSIGRNAGLSTQNWPPAIETTRPS